MTEELFFQLLQVATGNRKTLSIVPSAEQWTELFALSKKQALTAIAFKGAKTLSDSPLNGESFCNIPEMLYLKWLGLTVKIAQKNKVVTQECVELTKRLAHDSMMCCILKGQSNLVNYPEELRDYRTAGDIDVLMRSIKEPYAIVPPIRYCITQYHQHNVPVGKICYHHMDMPWDGSTEVEAHHRAAWLSSPLRNRRLQKWLEENMPFMQATAPECFPIPSNSYNAVYQLLHIYKHLFEEGIGLRQLLDYYFVLRALHIEQGELSDRTPSMGQWAEGMGISVKSNEEIMHTLGRFGMKKFAGAVMYVLKTVFAMPDEYLICTPNEKEGKFLLNEIMMAGNFGKYDERIKHGGGQLSHAIEKTKHNLRLLTHYPEEVLWEPWFRVYHWIWRKCRLWRW